MNEHACQENDASRGSQNPGNNHLPARARSFATRRAHYLSQSRKPSLTAEQQQALIRLAKAGDAGAKRKMIAGHMHLVIDFAKHYANRGAAPLELIREGCQGLIHALEEFDPMGCFSFMAFATWCICQNIEQAIMKSSASSYRRSFRPPVGRDAASRQLPAVLPNRPFDGIGGCIGVPA
jgi:DNA-directed RNA polymerase sigma subunit (sigma70/sigma32)